jgi:hypothetical protein
MKRLTLLAITLLLCGSQLFSLDIQKDIVQKAQQYIGSTYSSGGTNPPKFDCSGFVGFIMRPFVPNLPRVSRDMANAGKKIKKDELSPGDLVFFATTSVPGAVSHVALYIGQDSIIHAISDGPDRGVNITPLSSRYWKEHYHSAIRVLETAAQKKPAKSAPEQTDKPIQFAKGTYTGELKDGEPNGKGTLKLKNGDVYIGAFVKGSFNGKGLYTWEDGSTYEGDFENDLFHGTGTMKFSDGGVYVGAFEDGALSGKGVYSWSDGSKYEGDFADSDFHGKGIFTFPDGRKQNVMFENGKLVSASASAKKTEVKTDKVSTRETYIQKKDSPWDTWTGYVSGDFDAWREQEQKDFEEWKKENSR